MELPGSFSCPITEAVGPTAMEEEAGAITSEHLAAAGQEEEAFQRKRRRLQQWPEDVKDGGPDQTPTAALQQEVPEHLAREDLVRAVRVERLAASGQEVEASHGERADPGCPPPPPRCTSWWRTWRRRRRLRLRRRHLSRLMRRLVLRRRPLRRRTLVAAHLAQEEQAPTAEEAPQEPDELGDQQLASVHELRWIFSVLDHVEDFLKPTLGDVELPCVVLLGAEGSGKSTLLERLCMLRLLPRDRKLCRHMAVRVGIRRCAAQLDPTLEVWDVTKKQRVGNLRTVPLATGETAMQEEVGRIMQEASGAADAGVSVDRELRISLASPHLPPMHLVELPGLVENPPSAKEQTRRLAKRYIADHADGLLFLIVMSAESNPNQSPAITMIKEKGLEKRAVGVLTKCDRLQADEADFDHLRKLLTGVGLEGSIKLEPHGYVATSNKKAAVRGAESAGSALQLRARHELRFFREHGLEAEIGAGRATTQALNNKIAAMYNNYMRATWLPAALSRLRQEVRACGEADQELGGLPADLEGEPLKDLQTTAVAAAQAAAVSWLQCFYNRAEQLLEPLRLQLVATLSEVGRGIPVGCEFRILEEVQQKSADLCREAIGKLEALADLLPDDTPVNDPSSFRLQRLPGLTAKLHEALKAAVRRWDTLAQCVNDFLKRSLDPTTAPDVHVSYKVTQRPPTVDVVLPAGRIANTVRFMVGRSVGRATQEAVEEMARAITMEHLAAMEACQDKRQRLRRRRDDLKQAMHHLWQLKVGGSRPAQLPAAWVQQQVAEYLDKDVPAAVRPPAKAVAELNPAESARSYSSVFRAGPSVFDKSCLDSPGRWYPGPAAESRPGAEWAQLDLGEVRRVRGVVTQGFGGSWVTRYDVQASEGGAAFVRVAGGPFQGNACGRERATANFPAAVEARYVRIYPRSWNQDGMPCLRFGVLVET